MLTCLAAPCQFRLLWKGQFRLLWKGHVKLLTNSYSHLTRIAIEIVHFTLLHLGGLHGDVRILHLQLWNCTWQPPILTAFSSFPIKAGMNTRTSIRKLPILTGRSTSSSGSYTHRHFSFHWQCFEHLLHHVPRNLRWNTSLHFSLLPSPNDNQHWLRHFSVWNQHWLWYFSVWNQEYWIVVQIFF